MRFLRFSFLMLAVGCSGISCSLWHWPPGSKPKPKAYWIKLSVTGDSINVKDKQQHATQVRVLQLVAPVEERAKLMDDYNALEFVSFWRYVDNTAIAKYRQRDKWGEIEESTLLPGRVLKVDSLKIAPDTTHLLAVAAYLEPRNGIAKAIIPMPKESRHIILNLHEHHINFMIGKY